VTVNGRRRRRRKKKERKIKYSYRLGVYGVGGELIYYFNYFSVFKFILKLVISLFH